MCQGRTHCPNTHNLLSKSKIIQRYPISTKQRIEKVRLTNLTQEHKVAAELISLDFLTAGWISLHAWFVHQHRERQHGAEFLPFKNRCVIFFFFAVALRAPCKDRSFSCCLEAVALEVQSHDKVSAVHSKCCVQQTSIHDNASSRAHLCNLSEFCGIIIRLMPMQGWEGEEVK